MGSLVDLNPLSLDDPQEQISGYGSDVESGPDRRISAPRDNFIEITEI